MIETDVTTSTTGSSSRYYSKSVGTTPTPECSHVGSLHCMSQHYPIYHSQQSITMTSSFWLRSARLLMILEVFRSALIIAVVALVMLRCRIHAASFLLVDALLNIFVVGLLVSTLPNRTSNVSAITNRPNNIVPYIILKVLELGGYLTIFFVNLIYQKLLAELLCQHRSAMESRALGLEETAVPLDSLPTTYIHKVASQVVIATIVVCLFGVLCTSYLLFVAVKLRAALIRDADDANSMEANRQAVHMSAHCRVTLEKTLVNETLPPKYEEAVGMSHVASCEDVEDPPSYVVATWNQNHANNGESDKY